MPLRPAPIGFGADDPTPPPVRPALISLRPGLLSAVTLAGSAALIGFAPDYRPFSAFFRYALEVFAVLAVIVGASACWLASRSGRDWDADLIPALAGAVATFTLLGMLHGTPWGPNGLDGDQSFRTEFVTRFASSWQNADYT